MHLPQPIENILGNYDSESPGVKTNIARLLMHGKLAGTGKVMILPIDQGFEHGPGRTFASNPAAYDPHFFYEIAIEAGFSAYAAPLGLLEAGAGKYAGEIPLILKMNSGNSLNKQGTAPYQAVTSSIQDALRLGCIGVGFTIYPGSDLCNEMLEQLQMIIEEAKAYGLIVVVWSYARGQISKPGELSVDVIAYGAHMAALMGATLIKVKLPSNYLENELAKIEYLKHNVQIESLVDRVRHVVQACFNGKRMVVFSGGEAKDIESLYEEAKAIVQGGGNGSIMGRNVFQRPRNDALLMIENLMNIYKQKEFSA
jgi:class I fructose-bisphosphate aldolase